jgi:hypothetical protein
MVARKYDWSVGRRYGRLVIVAEVCYRESPTNGRNYGYVRCRCDCGIVKDVALSGLRDQARKTLSCGCAYREMMDRGIATTHGHSGTRLHRIWKGMLSRCYNPNRQAYPDYGGKGVRVCSEWRRDFPAFKSWAAANGYKDHLTIDRKQPWGDYAPANCRWLTSAANTAHKNARYLLAFGERKSIKDWAADPRCKVSYQVLKVRTRRGMDPEAAMTRQQRSQENSGNDNGAEAH